MAAIPLPPTHPTTKQLTRRRNIPESVIQTFLMFCGVGSVLTTISIVVVLIRESLLFFTNPAVKAGDFFTTTVWQPSIGKFGILPLVNATFLTSLCAMFVAIPLGVSAAIYLSEYASDRARAWLKPILEVLAGVPTVVYGYFALYWMTPVLRTIFGSQNVQVYNMASAGLVMGFMILPMITSISEDALRAVPIALRQAGYGLGATKFEVAVRVVVPAAFSGIMAALILGLSRAVGETMIVAIAAGAGPKFTYNLFESAETMTGYIARISGGDLSYGTPDYTSIFAIGLVLFSITLTMNLISRSIIARVREKYE
jgi:phosphate transport system permease protein